MKVEFHPAAKREFEEAVAYYDSRAAGLGDAFIHAVEEAVQRIVSFPDAWAELSPRTRRCRTSRFPYGVIYRQLADRIVIVAVMHLHREPGYWRDRI